MGHDSPSPENPVARFEAAKVHFKEAEEGLKETLIGILAEIKATTDEDPKATEQRHSLAEQAQNAYVGHLGKMVEYLSGGDSERDKVSGAFDHEIDDLVLQIGELNK